MFLRSKKDEVLIAQPKIHESVLQRIQNGAHGYAPLGLPASYDVVTDNRSIVPLHEVGFETSASAANRANTQENAWNTVWWRRIFNFLSVGVVGYLAIYPLMGALPEADEYASPIRWVSDIIRLIGTFLPRIFEHWLNVYARGPGHFLIVLIVLGVLLALGAKLEGRICDKMQTLWRASLNGSTSGRCRAIRFTAFEPGLPSLPSGRQ